MTKRICTLSWDPVRLSLSYDVCENDTAMLYKMIIRMPENTTSQGIFLYAIYIYDEPFYLYTNED